MNGFNEEMLSSNLKDNQNNTSHPDIINETTLSGYLEKALYFKPRPEFRDNLKERLLVESNTINLAHEKNRPRNFLQFGLVAGRNLAGGIVAACLVMLLIAFVLPAGSRPIVKNSVPATTVAPSSIPDKPATYDYLVVPNNASKPVPAQIVNNDKNRESSINVYELESSLVFNRMKKEEVPLTSSITPIKENPMAPAMR
jgi:hypothetical protein